MPPGRQGQISQSFTWEMGFSPHKSHVVLLVLQNAALNWATFIPDETLTLGTTHRGPVFSSVGTALSNWVDSTEEEDTLRAQSLDGVNTDKWSTRVENSRISLKLVELHCIKSSR